MISKQVAVKNETGLHARPAKEFVSKAKQFTSRITVRKGLEAEVKCEVYRNADGGVHRQG